MMTPSFINGCAMVKLKGFRNCLGRIDRHFNLGMKAVNWA